MVDLPTCRHVVILSSGGRQADILSLWTFGLAARRPEAACCRQTTLPAGARFACQSEMMDLRAVASWTFGPSRVVGEEFRTFGPPPSGARVKRVIRDQDLRAVVCGGKDYRRKFRAKKRAGRRPALIGFMKSDFGTCTHSSRNRFVRKRDRVSSRPPYGTIFQDRHLFELRWHRLGSLHEMISGLDLGP